MFQRTLCFGLLLLIAAVPALAEGGEKGDFELGLFAGQAFMDDYTAGMVSLNPDDDLLFGGRIGAFVTPSWSLEGSLQQLSTETRFDPLLAMSDGDFEIISVRYNALYNFRAGQAFRPFVTFGAGLEKLEFESGSDDDELGFNLGGGLRWFVGEKFGLRLDARWVSTEFDAFDDRQENLETSMGLTWAFGGQPPADSDGDGVIDRRDKCPDTPRGAVVDERGCPVDSDGDGVPDGIDRCPDTASGVPVDAAGCPRDSDGDGVHDGLDKCPDTPKGAKVDAKGCPSDSDGDGVYDGLDKCPGSPKGAKVDASGCPSDSDGDGVYDGVDKCPGTPKGAKVDASGCPSDSDGDGVFDGLDKCPGTASGVKVDAKGCRELFTEERSTLVLEGVNFEFNSAKLTGKAQAILDRVAMSLKQWPEIRVEVAGHTDSIGNDGYNLKLSSQRAASVRTYLEGKGVAAARMTAKGYGEKSPIADNSSKSGRDKNRRVELKRLD